MKSSWKVSRSSDCWLRSALAAVASIIFGSAISTSPASAGEARPNVLFIAIDDLNHWVGHLGRNRQTITPNLDRLATRGVTFTHAYCAAPVCNPSRTALLSGLRPNQTGVYDNKDDWRPVVDANLTLVTTFRKAGYYAAGAGKIYHGGFDRHSEWDDYLRSEGKEPKPTGDTGVGGIKFAPLDCRDEDLREWRIVQYGIDQLHQKHDRTAVLDHRPAQTAHAVERAAQVLRHAPARQDRAAADQRE